MNESISPSARLRISSPDCAPVEATAVDGWQARLAIELAPRAGRTVLTAVSHRGPLRVQRPFHPQGDGTCHVYLVHPPGGLVGGDLVAVDIEVAAGGRALITTPAAGKLYRSERRPARQLQTCRVGDGAALEWLPQENILFAGSWSQLATRVDLDPGATFVGWEQTVLGRPASGELFTSGRCDQSFELHRGGRPLWIERGRYDGGAPILDEAWGLAGRTASGVLVAAAPRTAPVGTLAALVPAVRALLDQHAPGGLHAATTPGDVLVCRMLAHGGEDIRRAFIPIWAFLRHAILGSPPALPRVWAT